MDGTVYSYGYRSGNGLHRTASPVKEKSGADGIRHKPRSKFLVEYRIFQSASVYGSLYSTSVAPRSHRKNYIQLSQNLSPRRIPANSLRFVGNLRGISQFRYMVAE